MSTHFQILSEYHELIAFFAGVLISIAAGFIYFQYIADPLGPFALDKNTEEVHVHSDFLMYINGNRIDFTDDKYQSATGHMLLEDFHLHDNNDSIIHRHAAGLTLSMFLNSLGYSLTDDCLITDSDLKYCTNEERQTALFVNGTPVKNVDSYIPQETDQILVFYGEVDSPKLTSYLSEISSDSCIYSGTCPERGTPPPESCGLTCEI